MSLPPEESRPDDVFPAQSQPTDPQLTPPVQPLTPPPPPATTQAVTPAAPQPTRSSTPLLLAIIGAAVVLALILGGVAVARARGNGGGLFGGASSTTPTAASILDHASKATLQDATFTLDGHIGVSLAAGSQPTQIAINGTGAFTANPARMSATLTIPFIGQQNGVDTFVDENAIYLKAPALLSIVGVPASDAAKWIKIPQGTAPATATDVASLYKQVQNPQIVASEMLNNQAVWHISGTLNLQDTSTPTAKATATPTPTKGTPAATVSPSTIDLWISKDTYYPIKIQLNATAGVTGVDINGLLPTGFPGSAATPAPTPTTGATGSDQQVTTTINIVLLFDAWNKGATLTPPPPSDVLSGFPTIPGLPGQGDNTPTPTPSS